VEDASAGLSGLRVAAASAAQGQRSGLSLAESPPASINHDGDADVSDSCDGGSSDGSWVAANGGAGLDGQSASQSAPFPETGEADFEGELLRKISRMQAISNKHPLTVWKREWCVASHNFLVFFASRTDLAVQKCLLLSTVRANMVQLRPDRKTFEVMLDMRDSDAAQAGTRENLEKLVLRVPRRTTPRNSPVAKDGPNTDSAEALRWVEQIKRRAQFAADSGRRLVPCMPVTEARDLTERFQVELKEAADREERQLQRQLASERQRALAASLGAVLAAKVEGQIRGAFEALVLHVRVQALCHIRLLAAGRRLARALGRPHERQFRGAFESWADTVSDATEAAQQVVAVERQRARHKAVHLGVLVLGGLLRDREQASAHHALVQLCRNAEGSRRREAPPAPPAEEVLFLSAAEDPAAAGSQQLRVAGHLLRAALRNLQASRREWALRTWSIMAARSQQAEAQELLRCTAELNEQLAERCKQVPLESGVAALVLTIHAAQMRRALFAFVALAAVPAGRLDRDDACQSKLHTVQSGTLLCARTGNEEQLSFSPPPREDADNGTSPAVRQLFPMKLAPSPVPLRVQVPAPAPVEPTVA